VIASALFLAACTQATLPQGPDAVWDLVIIGDSSLWELGAAYASQIEQDVGVGVVLHDFTRGGLSAGEVLSTLRDGEEARRGRVADLAAALEDAEVVVMFVNPVDSIDPQNPNDLEQCFLARAPQSCGPDTFEKWTADLQAIWLEIFRLRDGQPVILRATDIYNPLVIPWSRRGVLQVCTECWENMSDAARLAAEAYGIPFLSRLDAFNGPNHDEDPRQKGYIVSDGAHPSELAAQFTAALLSEMGYGPVPEP
jgi:hypothetical protein